ncbi:MAG: DUF6165 family protein [Alphaproteobacteria bacterium]|nr:DUF6165 family protein [Alphaproteobacteria bacterium]
MVDTPSSPGPAITIPISPGEVVDRLTILEIKSERISDKTKLVDVHHELGKLLEAAKSAIPDSQDMRALRAELKAVNEELWVIEDDIRQCERERDFGATFIALARAVYKTNDQRADLKRRINEALGSDIMEQKSYAPY